MATMQIQRAVKRTVKLKIGVQGPSGSGKTLGALALAKELAGDGRFLVIDTEHGSASTYADRYDFDTLDLLPPYTSDRYQEALALGVKQQYPVIVIDSISHQWDGDGGILRRKEELDQRGGNSYTNWSRFTPEHKQFVESMLSAPAHIIATMRSKTEYVLEANDRGKQVPRKVGTAPIQRDGMDYEFSIVFDVQLDHRAMATKDRTGLFDGKILDLLKPNVTADLKAWMVGNAAAPIILAESAEKVAQKEIESKHSKVLEMADPLYTISGPIDKVKHVPPTKKDPARTWLDVGGIYVYSPDYMSQLGGIVGPGWTIEAKCGARGEHKGVLAYELIELVNLTPPATVEADDEPEAGLGVSAADIGFN